MSGRGTAQQVLWAAGTRLLDAPLADGDAILAEILEEIAAAVGADLAVIADFDPRTSSITVRLGDPDGLLDDLPPVLDLPRAMTDALALGPAVITPTVLFGADAIAVRGWDRARVLAALIDEVEAGLSGVVFVGFDTPEWSADDLDLMWGTGLLVRQFERRAAAERRVAERQVLDRLALDVATTLQGVSVDRFDQAMADSLRGLIDALDATTALLIDIVDADAIEIPHLVSRSGSWGGLGRITLGPAIRARLGTADLDELAPGPLVFDGTELKADLLGEMLPPGPGQREARTALVVPAAAGGAGRTLLAVARAAGTTWTDDEVEVVTTVGAMMANTRALCLSEIDSQARFAAQATLTDIGRRFVNVTDADAIGIADEAFRDLAESLGADFAAVVRDTTDGPEAIRLWQGADASRPGPIGAQLASTLGCDGAAGAMSCRLEPDAGLREAWGIESDGPWDVVWSPVPRLGLTFMLAVPISSSVPSRVVADAVAAFGDLSSQLQLRAAAEIKTKRRLAAESLLASIADEFLGGSAATQAAVELRALDRIGAFLGLDGLVVHVFDEQPHVGAVWRAEGAGGTGVEVGTPLADSVRRRLAAADDTALIQGADLLSSDEVAIARGRWGEDVDARLAPAVVAGELLASVMAVGSGAWGETRTSMLRALAMMVGQFHARVRAERRDERLFRTEQLRSDLATELAEASADTVASAIRGAFAQVCRSVGLDRLTIWRVDANLERYEAVHSASPQGDTPDRLVPFGADDVLDRARASGESETSTEPAPTPTRPSLVALPWPDGDSILVARSTVAGPWQPETIELFRSIGDIVREVEARIAADRYADAAFNNAPIGIVLRDDHLRLITCNEAFLRFVGVGDVTEVVGTMPNEFYADGIEDVEWVDEDGALSAEAAFTRRDGSRVWGQMRASVVEGDDGGGLWLVHVEDVTDRRRAEALLRFQATHDELTGLANRGRLAQDILELAQHGTSAAVLLLDLDRFKNINDSMGHDRGDEMLVAIADRLRLAVRPGDQVARLGGDEFAVVLPGPVTVTDAEMVADRLLRLISEPMWLGSQAVYPTASIGIAISDTPELADLLRRADTAMYRAKAQGRAQHAAFDEALEREVTDRMATEAGLRGALRNEQFVVHYQPEVSTIDGRMLGAEALMRWEHPDEGIVTASSFIEVAEETGLVVELGEFVLRQAVNEAVSWPGGDDGPVVRVNLAAAQLQRDETVGTVRTVLAESGLAPHRLCLEITESAVMTDIERSEEILLRLKELGVMLAVDDFGTGFSSLAYLKRFPVDALKIDRTFVTDLASDDDDVAFVRSIISLADALGLEVVAEGVETPLQARILAGLGCHRAQGYLYAAPGPASDLRVHLPA